MWLGVLDLPAVTLVAEGLADPDQTLIGRRSVPEAYPVHGIGLGIPVSTM
jgi:hypothetical protein